jgi:hypothetical protein
MDIIFGVFNLSANLVQLTRSTGFSMISIYCAKDGDLRTLKVWLNCAHHKLFRASALFSHWLFRLIDFFRHYSREFPYNLGVASIRAGLLKKESKGWQNDVCSIIYNPVSFLISFTSSPEAASAMLAKEIDYA